MALGAGSIAFIGINADGSDGHAFVVLDAIDAGQVIYFRDDEWSGSAFNSGEGILSWTNNTGSAIQPGQIIEILNASSATPSVNMGTVAVISGSQGLGNSDEALYAYTSTDSATAGTFTFLTAFANGGYTASMSLDGTGLTAGTNAIDFKTKDDDADVAAYSPALGDSSFADKATALAAIHNLNNWVSQNASGDQDVDDTSPDAPFLSDAQSPLSGLSAFTIGAGGTPSVNLSVSSNTGSEAGATVITVTATASSAVSGAQTVDVAVTGTGITTSDYTLSAVQIAIATGQTTGTVDFTIQNDDSVEGAETATLTISNPSAGIVLGATTTQSVAISDNDATGVLAYTGQLNESKAFDGTVSGKIIFTLSGGETFTGVDNDNFAASKATITNVPAGLTAVLTRTSATTAELTLTGTATDHSTDVGNLTVAFANAAFTGNVTEAVTGSSKSDLAINFADIGASGTVQTFVPNTGTSQNSSDASTAIALDANWMVVGDDEGSVLRVYPRSGGAAVMEWNYSGSGALNIGSDELDLEASTRIGDTLYFTGSHSNNKSGVDQNSREHIFAVTISGSAEAGQFTYVNQYDGLESALSTWDSSNVHGKGANYFGITASAGSGVIPEAVNGFSIEGMSASQDGSNLLLAFRAPQSSTSSRDKAVIVPVTVASIFTGTPEFGSPLELDLGGRGIRSIEKAASGGDYLILAGPAGSASTEVTHDFRLYRWDGTSTTPSELNVDLDTLRATTGGSFETLVDVLNTSENTLVQLLQDNGDTVWSGKSSVSKDLPAAEQQFQGNWVSLGANVTDSTGPSLQSSTPADEAVNVGINTNLVLKFDEAVKAGSGDFLIKQLSDNSTVATIAANDAQVAYAFNTVTINPTSDLANATGYYLEAAAGTVTDLDGNNWAGISGAATLNFSTISAAPSYSLLISEVNSNASPADFFELYNYGSTTIDLSGWKWDDESANPADSGSVSLSGSLLPGASLVVVASSDATAFRNAWGLSDSVPVLANGGPGLGSGDAVAVFDQNGFVAASFNYKTTNVTATDGTVITPAVRSDSAALISGHAGAAVGGAATESAVWDGVSTSAPNYDDADLGVLGAFAQPLASANIGSPGKVLVGASLATPYSESFGTNLGEFTAYSVDADASHTWYQASSSYAEVNGYGDSAAANDWLISKAFDLSQTSLEYLSFTTWTRYTDTGLTNPAVKLYYSTTYTGSGNPTPYTWTELSYTASAENSQTTTNSGQIDLSAIEGSNVHFAFQYTSSGTGSNSSSSWRVDDINLTGYTGAVLSIAATDASKLEGNSGSTAYTFTVTRAGSTSGTTTVDYAVSGAAVDAADFNGTLPSGTVSFAAGETSQTVTLNVSGDTSAETNEAFTLTLSNASVGASISQASANGTILDEDSPATLISTVQGSDSTAAMNGQSVTIEGVVTAYMPNLKGFFIQEEAADSDNNAATSEGLFVYFNTANPGIDANSVGDVIRITGSVSEYNGLTELVNLSFLQVKSDNFGLPNATQITLPVTNMTDWEAVEGMLVSVSSGTDGGNLVVTDNYNLGQYGQVTLTSDALLTQYTEGNAPSVSGNPAYNAEIQRDQLILDDGSSTQNPATHYGRGGNDLSASNTLRGGDSVTSVTGVIDQFSSSPAAYETTYRLQPTVEPEFTGDDRPTSADFPTAITNAEIKVASVNVLNYFNTLGSTPFTNPNGTSHDPRGASDSIEFTRQQDKIVANLLGMDADVLGLMEMQNNGFADGTSAIDNLVDALNAQAGDGTYAYIAGPFNDGESTANDAATAGDDAIMVALLYKPSKLTPVGQAAVADPGIYDAFSATYGNRVPLAQTFRANADNEQFTVVVNHFKSKGSVIDADIGDGQGANNQARMEGAGDLLSWLSTNPTGTSDTDYLLIGDFNAYSHEDPITHLDNNGYAKVSSGLSYSYDGLWGSLDHALASDSLVNEITGVVNWGINAEEPGALDYNLEYKSDSQDASYYAADAYRSSDHNPILIGLNLGVAPVITSNAGGSSGEISVDENTSAVTTVTATDADAGDTLTYSLGGGADQAKFSIDPNTGVLTFVAAPDFEIPGAADTSNIYQVIVQVSDSNTNIDSQTLNVTVTDADEPTHFEGDSTGSVTEDSITTTVSGTLIATDPDIGDAAITAQTDSAGTFGNFSIGTNGQWSYTLNNSAANVQALKAGQSVTDSFAVATAGGASQNVVITVMGAADLIKGTANADSLTGTTGSDTIEGLAGNDTLDGGLAADTLIGGTGNDTFVVDNLKDNVVELVKAGIDLVKASVNHTLKLNVENLILTGSAKIGTGNAAANSLTGNASANTLNGLDGNDTLNGGQGADTLIGGKGNDSYLIDNVGDMVTEVSDGGIDLVQASVNHTLKLNVENLTLTGSAKIGTGNAAANSLIGNASANTLNGLDGNDTLNGGQGVDILIGGKGNDSYLIDNVGDMVTEVSDGGIDLVQASVNHILKPNVENLTLTGSAKIGTGNAAANSLTGNASANTLNGLDGNDVLKGLAGDDTLIGGRGKDDLTGGAGKDVFKFNSVAESLTGINRDVIQDFDLLDHIDLAAIDANSNEAGNQAFSFSSGAHFSNRFANPGDLFFDETSQILYGNTDADGQAEFSIQVKLLGLTELEVSALVL